MSNRIQKALVDHGDCIAEAAILRQRLTLLEASHARLLAAAKVAVHDESITMRSAKMLGDAINLEEHHDKKRDQ